MITSPALLLAGDRDIQGGTMNDPRAHSLRSVPTGLVIGFGRPGTSELRNVGKPEECRVVLALEERMWRDRREVGPRPAAAPRSLAGRIRAKVRDFVFQMQLGPVPDDAAGRDPETRF